MSANIFLSQTSEIFILTLQGSITASDDFEDVSKMYEDLRAPKVSSAMLSFSIMGNFGKITIIRMNCSFLALVRICVVLRSPIILGKRKLVNTLEFLRKPDEFRVK